MLYLILSIIIMFSMSFMRVSHPLSAGLILLIQTTLVAVASGTLNKTFWFSYILFLIFVGGMLVLFICVASNFVCPGLMTLMSLEFVFLSLF